ncbi:hypothetical protein ACFYUJ_00400 [Streptomyces sp. NPDC004520]|uniref:hypothetical protein n=1 Tax=Streptomyces sp. NPDC004520 TaxID=3364702 RepID=UPI0036B52081
MVFQKPDPFPSTSLCENVLAGLKPGGTRADKATEDELVEETVAEPKAEITVVIVEHGPTETVFGSPSDPRTADYVNGRFG